MAMATSTLCFKENEGSPVGHLSSIRWWSGYGSQAGYGSSDGHLKVSSMDGQAKDHQLSSTKNFATNGEKAPDKEDMGNEIPFIICPGVSKASSDSQKSPPSAATSLQPALAEYRSASSFDLGLAQPVMCARYPPINQCYGLFSAFAPQPAQLGRIMLPMSLAGDDGPIYVNAKQYNGIMRRRKSRAKAVIENKLTKKRKGVRWPLLEHEELRSKEFGYISK